MKADLRTFFEILGYVGALILLTASILNLHEAITENDGILIITFMGSLFVLGIVWMVHMSKFAIHFGAESIRKKGLWSREIHYRKIEQLTVQKGQIEIYGDSFFERLSFGNAYTNFEPATQKLARKINGRDDIEMEGKQKYLEEYLEVSS